MLSYMSHSIVIAIIKILLVITWKSGMGTPSTMVWQPPQTALVTVKPRNLMMVIVGTAASTDDDDDGDERLYD